MDGSFLAGNGKNHSAPTNTLNDFADAFVAIDKLVVFSRTLDSPSDEKTKIVRTGLREEILALKLRPGKDILAGGVDLSSQLSFRNIGL